jgi:threonine/homoserine/homoserine lactone efflux protein
MISILIALGLAHLAASMSPGPNTVLVIRHAAHSRRLGLITAAGFWPAGVIWSFAGLAGLGALIHAAPWIETALRLACSAYLLWIGIGMLRASLRNAPTAPAPPAIELRRAFATGFVTNLTNPKSLAYFSSIFGAVGAHELPLPVQAAAVFILPSIGFAWYATLTLLLSDPRVLTVYRRAVHWIERGAGALMIGFGLRLFIGPR